MQRRSVWCGGNGGWVLSCEMDWGEMGGDSFFKRNEFLEVGVCCILVWPSTGIIRMEENTDDFFGGIDEDQPTKPIQTIPNQSKQNHTNLTYQTEPNQLPYIISPHRLLHPPPHHHRCSRAYEAQHMDASRSLVRWMSWSLLLPRLDVVGFPVVWSWLVGWFLFIKPLTGTVGYGILYKISFHKEKN